MTTRDDLLLAATQLFAELGYAAASTDAIVRTAGVNKRMLYHHFGDKEGLFREVLLVQWQSFAVFVAEALLHGATPAKALDAAFDFLAAHPRFIRLVMWDGLGGGTFSRAIWLEARQPLFEHTLTLFGDGTTSDGTNSTKRREELVQSVISMLGATAFYFAYAPSITDVIGADPLSVASLKKRRKHLHKLLKTLTD